MYLLVQILHLVSDTILNSIHLKYAWIKLLYKICKAMLKTVYILQQICVMLDFISTCITFPTSLIRTRWKVHLFVDICITIKRRSNIIQQHFYI